MQGQRNIVHTLAESFELGSVSDQDNMNIESHIYQSDRANLSVASSLPDYPNAANGASCNFRNAGSHPSSSSSYVNVWGTAGANSTEDTPDLVCGAEDKMVTGWNPVPNMQSTSRFDERQAVDTNVLPSESANINLLNNQIMDDGLHVHGTCSYGASSDGNPYNLNSNQASVGNEGSPFMEASFCPCPTPVVGSEAEHMPFPSGFGVASLPENSNSRTNHSVDGRRGSCKRKSVEGISGQSSLDAPPRSSQWDEGNFRFTVPGRHNVGSGLSISAPAATLAGVRSLEEQIMPRSGVGMSDIAPDYRSGLSMNGPTEVPQRSVRIRFNPTPQQESNMPHLWPPGNSGRYMPDLQPHVSHSRRLFSSDQSVDTGPAGASTSAPLRQPNMFHVPSAIQRSLRSVGWNENSSMPRIGNPSSSTAVGRERVSSLQEDPSSRSMMMGISNNAWLVAGAENRIVNHDSANWASMNRNINGPGGITSTAQMCPNPMLHPAPAVPWGAHQVPFAQPPRRSSGAVQGPVSSSSVSRPAQSNSFPPPRTVPSTSSADILLPPGAAIQGPQYLRSALLMERQGDGILGVPFGSLQALTTEGDGRNRIMSEIRNVLELVRRGENLRFEDILILDQSAFYGAADLHDRHRDMRLDVDNMSYEELLALEERIGNVSTGLSEEAVMKYLKRSTYSSCIELSATDETSKKQPEDELCSICREEYKDNDELGVLDCGHIHHTDCIKQWLLLKNLCPICKKTALNT